MVVLIWREGAKNSEIGLKIIDASIWASQAQNLLRPGERVEKQETVRDWTKPSAICSGGLGSRKKMSDTFYKHIQTTFHC